MAFRPGLENSHLTWRLFCPTLRFSGMEHTETFEKCFPLQAGFKIKARKD